MLLLLEVDFTRGTPANVRHCQFGRSSGWHVIENGTPCFCEFPFSGSNVRSRTDTQTFIIFIRKPRGQEGGPRTPKSVGCQSCDLRTLPTS